MSETQFERANVEVPSFGDTAKAAADAFRVAGTKAKATVNEFSDDAYKISNRTREQLSHSVETWPLTAVAVAAGVGLLAGLLWPRH